MAHFILKIEGLETMAVEVPFLDWSPKVTLVHVGLSTS